MSNQDKKPPFLSPLASKFKSFASDTSNLLSSFENVQSPSTFSFAAKPPPSGVSKPSAFEKSPSEPRERSVTGKSGGVNTVRVFVLDDMLDTCCGAIGTSGEKFCTLPCLAGLNRCDIKSHSTKAVVDSRCVYICVTEQGRSKNAAFCSPFLPLDTVGSRLATLQNMHFTVKTWNRIFSGFRNLEDVSDEAFNEICQKYSTNWQAPFTAMKKRRAVSEASPDLEKMSMTDLLPNENIVGSLSSLSKEQDQAFKLAWRNLIQCVSALQSDIPSIKSDLKRTKLDLEISVEGVESSVELLATDIGSDPGIDQGAPVTSVWSGIQLAINSAREAHALLQQQQQVLTTVSQDLKSCKSTYKTTNMNLRTDFNMVTSQVQQLLTDFEHSIGPSLNKLIDAYKVGAGHTNLPLGYVLQRLKDLEARVTTTPNFPHQMLQPTASVSDTQTQELQNSISTLATEVKLIHDKYACIDDKLHSEAVQLDDFVFGSRIETERWVRIHIPGNDPDGLHDIMTLLMLGPEPHISFKEGMDEAYFSSKVGFTSSSGARNAHSFKCELPDIFGRMVSGSDKGFPLPALKTQKIWNPNDGVSGVRRSTTQSLKFKVENIKLMLSHFYGTSEAYRLAFTMLSKSYSFWISLANWIDEFHQKLTIVSCCTVDEAWLLVASCVRGVFRELRRVRIVAQEAEKIPDKATSRSLFLWGSLQAHRIMDEFLIHSFKGHPVITPVINMHLFQHRVPISMHNSLKVKVMALEKIVLDHKKELDRLKTATSKKTARDSS